MARYLLVRIEDNKKADALRTKLDGVEGVLTVGKFAIPIEFCDGKCQKRDLGAERDGRQRHKVSKKLGWTYCPVCRKAKMTLSHSLRNLLEPDEVPPRMRDCILNVFEPYFGDPVKKYGKEVFEKTLGANLAAAEEARYKRLRKIRRDIRRAT